MKIDWWEILWGILALLWIFLAAHYLASYLDWREWNKIRREEREEEVEVSSMKAKEHAGTKE